MKSRKLRSWWRKDSAVTHYQYGEGVITNFVACRKDEANVYFYSDDCVRPVTRSSLKRAVLVEPTP